jgi:hypothetical protein
MISFFLENHLHEKNIWNIPPFGDINICKEGLEREVKDLNLTVALEMFK